MEPETSDFQWLVMNAPRAATEEDAFAKVFVEGAELDKDRKRYRLYRLELESDSAGPEDNTRTLKVVVKDSSTTEAVGKVDWTAVKVGQEWRIKAAPLPPASGQK